MTDTFLAELAQRWIQFAQDDISTAEAIRNRHPGIACYHIQQAIEKYLKAFLVAHRVPLLRTHSIPTLIIACNRISPGFDAVTDGLDIDLVNGWATEYRYPSEDNIAQPTEEVLKIGDLLADRIRTIVTKALRATD